MLCAGPGLQSSSCRVMLYHTRSTEDGNAYSLQRVLGAASRWPSAWAGKRCFRTRSQHPAESFARLHNPPCMALPCCPPFAQGGLSLCPGALSGPFLNRFARIALWPLPVLARQHRSTGANSAYSLQRVLAVRPPDRCRAGSRVGTAILRCRAGQSNQV